MSEGPRITAIHLAATAGGPMQSVAEVRAVAGAGLEGDRYAARAGRFSRSPGGGREVTLVATEELELLAREHGLALAPADTRRNLATCGVSLNELVGREFQVGAVRLRGVRLCEPCEHLAARTHPLVLKALVHRAGLRADIVEGGVIRVGDTVRAG